MITNGKKEDGDLCTNGMRNSTNYESLFDTVVARQGVELHNGLFNLRYQTSYNFCAYLVDICLGIVLYDSHDRIGI